MPTPPVPVDTTTSTEAPAQAAAAEHPYRQLVADLRGAIGCGALAPGDPLPTTAELKERYGVSAGTANRAIAELKQAGLVTATRGRRVAVS
jgi:DNA-binding GntR family transcriptional regulator